MEIDGYAWRYALIVVHATKEEEDEVCDQRANSADHNQSNAAYCYRRRARAWRGPCVCACVYVMEIITAKTAEPIEMTFGSDCPA